MATMAFVNFAGKYRKPIRQKRTQKIWWYEKDWGVKAAYDK